jgi:hypothetical protein
MYAILNRQYKSGVKSLPKMYASDMTTGRDLWVDSPPLLFRSSYFSESVVVQARSKHDVKHSVAVMNDNIHRLNRQLASNKG